MQIKSGVGLILIDSQCLFFSGLIVRWLPAFQPTFSKDLFDDDPYWHVSGEHFVGAASYIVNDFLPLHTHTIAC